MSDDKMFFTTSDLMEKMNSTLRNGDTENFGPQFELQKRLPDGSTRRANDSEMAMADFQSKLKQAAVQVEKLQPEQKMEWAINQRKKGNDLFSHANYKEAMDVYLTCLVAMDTESTNKNVNNSTAFNNNGNLSSEYKERVDRELKLPVLLNLSACTLKLGMIKKTEQFCNIALQIPLALENPKVYFRRGRAHMLTGSYHKAREDFEKTLELMSLESSPFGASKIYCLKKEQEKVRKEIEKTFVLEKSAHLNYENNKAAMKRALGGGRNVSQNQMTSIKNECYGTECTNKNVEEESKDFVSGGPLHFASKHSISKKGMYDDIGKQRLYSTLTDDSDDDSDDNSYDEINTSTKVRFFRWYILLFSRVLSRKYFSENIFISFKKRLEDIIKKKK